MQLNNASIHGKPLDKCTACTPIVVVLKEMVTSFDVRVSSHASSKSFPISIVRIYLTVFVFIPYPSIPQRGFIVPNLAYNFLPIFPTPPDFIFIIVIIIRERIIVVLIGERIFIYKITRSLPPTNPSLSIMKVPC